MKGDADYSSPLIEALDAVVEQFLNVGQLLIDLNANGLKSLGGGMDLLVEAAFGHDAFDDGRQLTRVRDATCFAVGHDGLCDPFRMGLLAVVF